MYSGLIVKRFEDAKAYMRFHCDYVRTLLDEIIAWMMIRYAPPLPFLPEDVHGKLVPVVPFVWLGDQAKGEALIRPSRRSRNRMAR